MARRPAPTSLDDAILVEAPNSPAQKASERQAKRPASARSPSREGKRGVAYWLEPDAFQALRLLSFQTERPVQSLMEEATDLLFRAHGVHPLSRGT